MATENIHVEHKKVSTASFDVKNRRLVLPIWKDMTNTLYEGLIGHEVGHALYTPYEEWAEFSKENKNLKGYANILEDARIERKMKIKYPGMKKTFFGMYDSLSQRDFFGTRGKDLSEYGFADRLNLDFKLGVLAEVPFSDEEKEFRDRVLKAETFEEILGLTKELGELAKDEAETDMHENYEEFYGTDDDDDDENDEDTEPKDSAPFPSPSDEDDSEEEESDESSKEEEKAEGEGNTPNTESEESEKSDEEKEEANPNAGGETEAEAPDLSPAPPEPKTQKAWDEAMEAMNDEEAKEPVYVDLPIINPTNTIIPWKDTFEELTSHWTVLENFAHYRYSFEDPTTDTAKIEEERKFQTWKKDTSQIVNYMVKEFEMKQAATAYHRTSISKTGVLDMNKLHKYKTDEDIFKRVAAVKDGRNHALLMFIDWSGSMHNKMEATVKQMLTLVMFAKKVGIPFRVYSFSNSGAILDKCKEKFYDRNGQENQTHMIPGWLGMHEYFNEKMSTSQFNAQLRNISFLGKSLDYGTLSTPVGHGTCSTPLNECIMAATEMVSDFKKETGAEKINAIFLTDGGADNTSNYWDAETMEKRQTYSMRSSDKGKYLVIRDAKTKRLVHTDQSRGGLTASLLKHLGAKHQINVIGFHITDRRTIHHQLHYEVGYGEMSELKSFCNKNGYVPMKQSGYDTYFLINDKSLDQEAIFDDPAHNDDGTIAKGKLRTQFRKFTSARKVNKMMLNEFVALVA
jgi:hypothetical protein